MGNIGKVDGVKEYFEIRELKWYSLFRDKIVFIDIVGIGIVFRTATNPTDYVPLETEGYPCRESFVIVSQ